MRLCGGPPWAAVFGRPMARQPTALMKNGMPLFMILFGQSFAGAHLVSDSSRQLGLQKGAHLGTELLLLHREIEVHRARLFRSEEHTSELQSLMRISYAVFCLKKKTQTIKQLHSKLQLYTN